MADFYLVPQGMVLCHHLFVFCEIQYHNVLLCYFVQLKEDTSLIQWSSRSKQLGQV